MRTRGENLYKNLQSQNPTPTSNGGEIRYRTKAPKAARIYFLASFFRPAICRGQEQRSSVSRGVTMFHKFVKLLVAFALAMSALPLTATSVFAWAPSVSPSCSNIHLSATPEPFQYHLDSWLSLDGPSGPWTALPRQYAMLNV